MRLMRRTRILVGLAIGVAFVVDGCGKSASQSATDGAARSDAPAGTGGGSGGSGGTGNGGAGGAGGSSTGGITGTGGTQDVCAGKAGNCHPFPTNCQPGQCVSCPCEGGTGGRVGTGGATGGGGAGGSAVTGGASGSGSGGSTASGGTGGADAGCGCPNTGATVCGSGQKNYPSACAAACAGAAVIDGCSCGRPDGAVCGCATSIVDIICGTDGQTWTNACLASQNNIGVKSVGVCGTGAPHGTLGLGASCDVVHELCASGFLCCQPAIGTLPPDSAPLPYTCTAVDPLTGRCPMGA